MQITETSDVWWKTAVVYCLDVETFYDLDGNGIGDLSGLAERIDYLAELGVTCLWLMPFYPTPDRDDGYDIVDFYGVDPRLGNHGQLVEVLRTAHDRGINVIADLVVNHTSDQHPWFKASRRSKDNPFRDYYVWRDTEPPDTSKLVVFPDKEDSIWELDERTGEWYLHNFYKHQPDLNLANPRVVEEILRIVGFWLELGFDGFRVDGIPFLEQNADNAGDPALAVDPHQLMRRIRAFVNRRAGHAMMLGEVNLPHPQQREFFGGDAGNELQMQFDFIGMQATYLALARGDAAPLVEALQARPEIHRTCQWATFLRNHDELTLDKLSDTEREEVFAAFGPDPEMQLFARGLKRRLPPMMGGDPRRIRMAYSLLFTLPGTPTLYYGEEIGMGEDLAAEGRMAVRTPMQWTSGRNGGFSSAAPRKLVQRVVPDGYGPAHVNVADQRRDADSLWSYMRTLIGTYRMCPELGWGEFSLIEQPDSRVFAHRCDLDDVAVVAVHNLGADAVVLDLPVDGLDETRELVDLFSQAEVATGAGSVEVSLEGYGFRWYRLRPHGGLHLP
ncbi:trehalose synthase [Nocardioides sp. Soil774]|uniref:alpha-amylase family protein n=1 Tax=Nocardioides sp. Soil774 TaxID=1736408 RepID=UPI0006F9BDF9|nr:alpha-amylase family protein [Nocardioides sp. Soil774]KRE93682.1 trehalose synthase [Nocardioides sp. Soil774]